MRFLVNVFLHPMTWLVIGFFILWLMRKRFSIRKKRILTGALFGFFFLTTTPWLPKQLIAHLEDQHQPLDVSTADRSVAYNIIVLGGGMGYDDRLPATSLLEPVSLVRLVEGIRVHRALPLSKIITSGYSSIGRTPQAFIARDAAILLGVNDTSVMAQGEPSNTMEEATYYIKKYGKETPLVIATSATHMPRAVFIFKKMGLKSVIPAPTYFRIKKQNPVTLKHFIKPEFGYWGDMQACLHEYVGLWWAKWKLRT